ncbi:MAG: hypothetical protein R2741_07405 [Methanolobus sp.]
MASDLVSYLVEDIPQTVIDQMLAGDNYTRFKVENSGCTAWRAGWGPIRKRWKNLLMPTLLFLNMPVWEMLLVPFGW